MVARFLLRLITDSHNLHYGIYSYNITVCALGYGEGAATTAADDALKIVARGTVKRTARQPMRIPLDVAQHSEMISPTIPI